VSLTVETQPLIDEVRSDLNRLRGRLFECVESFGLSEKQERAMKAVIRRQTYDSQATLEALLRNADRT
jgi:hypothetical protein